MNEDDKLNARSPQKEANLLNELEILARQNAAWKVMNVLITQLLGEPSFTGFITLLLKSMIRLIGGRPSMFIQLYQDQWTEYSLTPEGNLLQSRLPPENTTWIAKLLSIPTFAWSSSNYIGLNPQILTDLPKNVRGENFLGFSNTKAPCAHLLLVTNLPSPEYSTNYLRELSELIIPINLALQYSKAYEDLGIRAIELEHAKDAADQANRAKSVFLSHVSHELRTPLNAIMGFTEILQNQILGPINVEQQDALAEILKAETHLTKLIEDLLDLTRIETGRFELDFSEISLNEIINTGVRMMEEIAKTHQIQLQLDLSPDLPRVLADERRILQVVINLLNNAIKYTPDHGTAGLITTFTEEEVQVTIWDTGIGIASQDLPKLFQHFQRLETTVTRNIPGNGIGLEYSKRLIELHHGQIGVESVEGKGSRFFFTLPRRRDLP